MIIRCVEKPDSRVKRENASETTYEYTLTLVSNSVKDTEATVRAYPGVPRRGSPYVFGSSANGTALCYEIEIRRTDHVTWEAACRYSTKIEPLPPPQGGSDILLAPTKVHWSGKEVEGVSVVGWDEDGVKPKPFLNSFGDMMKGAPIPKWQHGLVTFTRNESLYNPSRAIYFAGKINSLPWLGCKRNTAKCSFPEGDGPLWDEKKKRWYWTIVYSFEIAPESWTVYIPDRGKMYIRTESAVDAQGNVIPGQAAQDVKCVARDDFGVPTGEDVWLDGEGGKLRNDYVKAGKLFPLKWGGGQFADFNQLRLP